MYGRKALLASQQSAWDAITTTPTSTFTASQDAHTASQEAKEEKIVTVAGYGFAGSPLQPFAATPSPSNTTGKGRKKKRKKPSSSSGKTQKRLSFLDKARIQAESAEKKRKTQRRLDPAAAAVVTTAAEGHNDHNEQVFLDFGQKDFTTTCTICGMMYYPGQAMDEQMHSKYHQKFSNGISFPGWAEEQVLATFADNGGRIIEAVDAGNKKVTNVIDMMDRDLGGYRETLSQRDINQQQALQQKQKQKQHGPERILLYVVSKKVVGCVVARRIKKAYRIKDIPELCAANASSMAIAAAIMAEGKQEEETTKPAQSEPAQLGIEKVWVHPKFRRTGAASRMLDAVRCNLIYGTVVSRAKLVFSQPTTKGKSLARGYTGLDNYLVYQGFSG
jgi:N-acetyltransferase